MPDKTDNGKQYGPVRSPMEEDFAPSGKYNPTENCVTGTVPGYPKSNDGKIKEVLFDEGGNFGKVPMAKE